MNEERAAARALRRLQAFIRHEATAGFILVLAAATAMLAYNIPAFQMLYDQTLRLPISFSAGSFGLAKPLLLWVNDGLMAIFFFLVGLELKREFLEGSLASREQIVLPSLAALGGMALPALIFVFINRDHPANMAGWAIPAATDIAFALAAISILGDRIPLAAKVFLLTLATLDDLGAIVIIALFYTANLSFSALVLAGLALATLLVLNRLHVSRTAPYVFAGLALWVFVLKSGVHATLAGVALAFFIPLQRRDGRTFVHAIEEGLHPYVKFAILPLFAFANAGIPFDGFALSKLMEPLPLGIAAGLAIGKPIGILLLVGGAVALGVARLPEGCNRMHMAGVGCLAGIGFTMSLFIGSLAFADEAVLAAVRVGVVTGSVLSAALGLALLSLGMAEKNRT
jgi:NhaA family Na+:H+ antiporter